MKVTASDYRDLQKRMLIITTAAIIGMVLTPLLPWVENSGKVSQKDKQTEVSYGYTEHHLANIESGDGDLLPQDEVDYQDLVVSKDESEFESPDNFTSGTRGDVKQLGANGSVSSIDRDLALQDIPSRIFQISLCYWLIMLAGVSGLIGINLLRKKGSAKAGRHLIYVSYSAFILAGAILILHIIIVYDINLLNTYNSDMGILNSEYQWWYNFAPGIVGVLILIISGVFIKRSFLLLRD